MRLAVVLSLAVVSGCMPRPPAPSVTPRDAMAVNASMSKTWDAVIDVFAERNIPIRNMDRASGFISTDDLSVGRRDAQVWADCGRVMGMPLPADRAVYNVLVRGGEASSTVRVTVRWTQGGSRSDPQIVECTTKGVWESSFEADVKARAE